ncbi:MAG: hypothetical protein EOO70_10240 [Myxococcaceae bacterium]|nr:MAG: hypothetical protein EOO70_10240 [Myxococcaceae bacterium]
MMRKITILLGMFVAAALAPVQALACRQIVPREGELASYRDVVVASVRKSEKLSSAGSNTWRIHGEVTQVVFGSHASGEITFFGTNGTCPMPEPALNDRWVIYINEPVDGFQFGAGTQAFPLSDIKRHDDRLKEVR